jgi:PAS domain-containing protein
VQQSVTQHGPLVTRERVARDLGMAVSTFDRYRQHYDAFRNWQETAGAYYRTRLGVESGSPGLPPATEVVALPTDDPLHEKRQPRLMFVVAADDGRILQCNDAACEATGYLRVEMAGMRWGTLLCPMECDFFSRKRGELYAQAGQ